MFFFCTINPIYCASSVVQISLELLDKIGLGKLSLMRVAGSSRYRYSDKMANCNEIQGRHIPK